MQQRQALHLLGMRAVCLICILLGVSACYVTCQGVINQTASAPAATSVNQGVSKQTAPAPVAVSSGQGSSNQTAPAPVANLLDQVVSHQTARAPAAISIGQGVSKQTAPAPAAISIGTAYVKAPAALLPAADTNPSLTCYIPVNITSGAQQLCSVQASAIFSQEPKYSGFPIVPVCARYLRQCTSIDLMALNNATVCSREDVEKEAWKWNYQVMPNMDACTMQAASNGTKMMKCCSATLCNAPDRYYDSNTTITGLPCDTSLLTAALRTILG